MKQKIMIFCDFYLPGYKSGGGMWTLVNLVDRFCDQYDFLIVARNYDSRGDTKPYTTVKSDEWNQTGNAKVFYFSKKTFTQKKFADLVNEIKPDAFFLNSVFSTPVIKFLAARRKKLFSPEIPLILAPCGEISKGALSVKPLKKKLFLRYAKTVKLYRNIIWKASSDSEKEEVKDVMGANSEVFVAPDLAPKRIIPDYSQNWKPFKEKGSLRLVFMSRLVQKKNMHYLLECLRFIESGKVALDLVGPLEDQNYWRKCLEIIKTLPENIEINPTGAFPYQEALKKMTESHFFVMPTLNENFGYVFIEAMAAGCPQIISDRTIWNEIEQNNAGWCLPLEDERVWIDKINYCLQMENEEYRTMSKAARAYSEKWLDDPQFEQATAKVLQRALSEKANTAKITQ